ncbi:uncharacterized protein [Hyperolius riggenbachi]|uniref:uncharacterized protein n=1 Tax=Hyperolius riggenbachi TaxID=752182 RepID=UPI0035A373B7
MSSMDQSPKTRPKSAPVITNAYIQNKREDEDLCEKLDSLHYQHYAGLIKLRQAVGSIVKQKRILLTQRAITPQSRLDQVLDEIHTYKKDKHYSGVSRSRLPASTELHPDYTSVSKRSPPPFSQGSFSASHAVYEHPGARLIPVVTGIRIFPSTDNTKTRTVDATRKHDQTSDKSERKPRASSALQRRPASSMEVLTYKELSGIARLENITEREAARQKRQMQMEKMSMSNSLDCALQEKVHNFLKKLE